MQYLLLMIGSGDGCDYTIGCNKTWAALDGKTLEEAQAEAERLIAEYNDPKIQTAEILAVHGRSKMDVDTFYKARRERIVAEIQAARERQERQEYERLKAKFGESK